MKLKVKISPAAKNNEIIGWFGDQLKIKIAAVPEKGQANEELVKFLSKKLESAKNSITILQGLNSTSKLLNIEGISMMDLNTKLGIPKVQDALI